MRRKVNRDERQPPPPVMIDSTAVREAEAALGTTGRVLVRPSGTEPVLRIMVEARDAQIANTTAARLEDIAKRELV